MSDSEIANAASDRRRLAEFLVGNSELEELSARLGEFNILRVLRIEQAEIRHSNVLGWLLDPRESHGLGDTFVRRFVSTLLLDNERADFGLSPATVELMALVDVEVRREWRNIDVLVHSRANRLVLLIENKIRARESKGQLLRYVEAARRSFPDARVVVPVYLTVERDEPSKEARAAGYVSWSHAELYGVATEVVRQNQNRIPQDAQTFLRHYLDTLRRETMQDKELEDLCKSIYRKHKAAIDLIVRYGATTAFGEAAEAFVYEHAELVQLKSAPSSLWFIPKGWTELMPKEIKGWQSPYPVSVWFSLDQRGQKLGIIMEIGPLAGAERRRKLVDAFRQAGYKLPAWADEEGARYTRFFRQNQDVRDVGDPGEVKQVLDRLWRQSKDEVERAERVLENFAW